MAGSSAARTWRTGRCDSYRFVRNLRRANASVRRAAIGLASVLAAGGCTENDADNQVTATVRACARSTEDGTTATDVRLVNRGFDAQPVEVTIRFGSPQLEPVSDTFTVRAKSSRTVTLPGPSLDAFADVASTELKDRASVATCSLATSPG